MIRRPPRSTLFPYTNALPISSLLEIDVRHQYTLELAHLALNLGRDIFALFVHGILAVWPSIHRDRTRLPLRNSRSEEHTSELQSLTNLVCRLLLEKKKKK